MARTTKPTTALGKFGVYGAPSENERLVLALADEYREKLAASYHREYMDRISLRNMRFPELIEGLKTFEAVKYKIHLKEKRIKEHHSSVRDRNAVKVVDECELEELRAERNRLAAVIAPLRKSWSDLQSRFRVQLKASAPECGWKQVKTLAKRVEAYEQIDWPEELSDYAQIWIDADLERRRLSREYQDAGLHPAIRSEIVDATKPKLGKNSPGMRYQWGRRLDLRQWKNITIQFGGGLLVADAVSGRCPGFRITPIYTKTKTSRKETVVDVMQQIGTRDHPRVIEYRCKLHIPLPDDAVLQRWSLVVDGRKRYAIPLVSGIEPECCSGSGALRCNLGWRAVPGGVQVATFRSEHVSESLVIPDWIIDRRLGVSAVQAETDQAANAFLETRGISASKTPGNGISFGVAALEDYCIEHPEDGSAAEMVFQANCRVNRARKDASRAIRCIEKIYETAVHRLRRLHDRIVDDYEIDLRDLKRYDTRDLLAKDAPPRDLRERRDAVSPGKLQGLLRRSGMRAVASDEVPAELPVATRSTAVVTGYVDSLGRKTGAKPSLPCCRSQHDAMEAE